MTLKNNRAPLLSIIKLYASFHHHMWIQTIVTVRKRLSWVLTSVTLTFDLWPWPFAWTSLLPLVITPENFMMIRWWEHSEKCVTDGRTDRWTDWTSHIAASSQLKTFDSIPGCMFILIIIIYINVPWPTWPGSFITRSHVTNGLSSVQKESMPSLWKVMKVIYLKIITFAMNYQKSPNYRNKYRLKPYTNIRMTHNLSTEPTIRKGTSCTAWYTPS